MILTEHKKNNFGFTLVELLIVIAIIAILMAVSLIFINPGERLRTARDSQRVQEINNIVQALKLYYIDNGEYPGQYTETYTGEIGIGLPIDTLLAPYLGSVPKDPHPSDPGCGRTRWCPSLGSYYYFYDGLHACWLQHKKCVTLEVYSFETQDYTDNFSNLEDVCPGTGSWGSEGGVTPAYVFTFNCYDD
ncbi:MAG: prepilin-type N-terminal cleavage/methylation domain-containing protein [Patescibacteria group bacterium]